MIQLPRRQRNDHSRAGQLAGFCCGHIPADRQACNSELQHDRSPALLDVSSPVQLGRELHGFRSIFHSVRGSRVSSPLVCRGRSTRLCFPAAKVERHKFRGRRVDRSRPLLLQPLDHVRQDHVEPLHCHSSVRLSWAAGFDDQQPSERTRQWDCQNQTMRMSA